jgi:multimeric flavodoxin WrbA
MKVVAINGSARRDGNTAQLINHVFSGLETEGVETEMIQLSGEIIRGCTACYRCFGTKDNRCAVSTDNGDIVNDCIARIAAADGLIIASPTYFADVSAETKAIIDRVGMVGRANPDLLRRKVGAAVVAVRRGGAIHVFDTINHFFLIAEMIVVGSSYWNIGIGRNIGEVENDQEGVATMATLGKNMAWLMDRIKG